MLFDVDVCSLLSSLSSSTSSSLSREVAAVLLLPPLLVVVGFGCLFDPCPWQLRSQPCVLLVMCVCSRLCGLYEERSCARVRVSGTLGNDVVVSEHTTSTALRSSATSPRRETLTAFLFVFVASYWHYNCGLCFAYRLPYKSSETCLFSDGPRPGARCLCREEALCSNPDALQEIKESKLTSESRSAFVILPCTFHYVLHAGSPSKYAVVLGMGWPSK